LGLLKEKAMTPPRVKAIPGSIKGYARGPIAPEISSIPPKETKEVEYILYIWD